MIHEFLILIEPSNKCKLVRVIPFTVSYFRKAHILLENFISAELRFTLKRQEISETKIRFTNYAAKFVIDRK